MMSTSFVHNPHARGRRFVEIAIAVSLAAVFAAAFSYPIVDRFGRLGGANDWDQHLTYHFVPYISVVRYHQVPLWDPYMCGGNPDLAQPQSRILTPFFLLHLIVGPEAALQLEIVLHLMIAVAGGYYLGRVLGLSRLASMLVGIVFPASSWFYLQIGEGHSWILPYLYLPWVAALFWSGLVRGDLFRAAIAGAVIALQVGEGGIWAAPVSALTAFFLTVIATLQQRRVRPFRILLCTAAVGLALAAPKLLPMWQLMRVSPRLVDSTERTDIRLLHDAFLAPNQDRYGQKTSDVYVHGFHEYGAFVGTAIALLALCSVIFGRQRLQRCGPWAALVCIALLLGAGRFETSTGSGQWSLWAELHRLPVFSSMHVPSRFFPLAVFAVGILAGIGFDALGERFGKLGTIAGTLCGVFFMAQAWQTGPPNLKRIYDELEEDLPPAPVFRQAAAATWDHMYPFVRAGLGAVECYEYAHLPIAALSEGEQGYRGEAYVQGPGQVSLVSWSPNSLSYDTEAAGEAVLIINQNFDSSWVIGEGRGDVVEHDGLLAVRLPSERQHLTLTYHSRSFVVGCVLAIVAMVFVVTFSAIARSRRAVAGSREPSKALSSSASASPG